MDEKWDVLLSYSIKDRHEVRDVADALQHRGFRVWLDGWEEFPDHLQRDKLSGSLQVRSVAFLFGSHGLELWSMPRMFGFLSTWIKHREPLILVLLSGAPGDLTFPPLFHELPLVDFREGITDEELDYLEWGITGKKPSSKVASKNLPPADDRQTLTPEDFLQLAFRLVVVRRGGSDLLLHLDAARLLEAAEAVLDESSRVGSPLDRLRAAADRLAGQLPEACPDPLWQKWMLITQRKTLEDLAAALASAPSSPAPPA